MTDARRHRAPGGVRSRLRGALGAILAALLLGGVLGGCESGGPIDAGPLPPYAELRESYNQRIAGIDRLWARTTVQVTHRDAEGDRQEDQGEGWVQFIEPDRVALLIGKYVVGEVYFHLGSDADRYWWIDALNKDDRIALVGEHATARPETAAEFGVPVHPLDLIQLLAITPLPTQEAGAVRWSEGRDAWLVDYPARFGSATVRIDPRTFEALGVVLRDATGEVAAESQLSRYRTIRRFSPGVPGSVAGQVEIDLPTIETEIRMDVYDPESNPRKPKKAVFDFDHLLEHYGVDRVVSVEEVMESRRRSMEASER